MTMEILNEVIKLVRKDFLSKNVKAEKQQEILDKIIEQYNNKSINFAEKLRFKTIVSFGKKRRVAFIKDKFSLENYLIKYLSIYIEKITNTSLYDMKIANLKLINYLKQLNSDEFTMVRFDFKNYYNHLSMEYIYKKFIQKYDLKKEEQKLLELFASQVPYCFAGLPTSNVCAEIMNANLEVALTEKYNKISNCLCLHFSDDFNIFADKTISKEKVMEIIESTIFEVYHDKNIIVKNPNKEKIHTSGDKFVYLTKKDLPKSFYFVGQMYTIFKNYNEVDFRFGSYNTALQSYKDNLKSLIWEYKNNIPAQKVILELHSKKVAYKPNANSNLITNKFNGQTRCLKFAKEKIDENTTSFLKNVYKSCYNELNLCLPYFLKNKHSNKFDVYNNIVAGKSIILKENCLSFARLKSMCRPFEIKVGTYEEMASNLALKCKLNY